MNSFKQFFEAVENYRPDIFEFLKSQPDDTLVHFTDHHRIGIKTRPSHRDPIGIYAFPKQYVLSDKFNNNHHFFSKQNAFFLKLKPNVRILDLSSISEKEVNSMLDQFQIEPEEGKSPGDKLWKSLLRAVEGKSRNISWNRYLKDFDVIKDNSGIIHSNEPQQVAILNPKAYVEIDVLSSDTSKIYKNLAYRIINDLSNKLFPEFKITTSKESSRRRYASTGTIDNQPFNLSLTYYAPDSNHLNFSAEVFLSSHYSKDYFKEMIRIPTEESSEKTDAHIQDVYNKMKQWVRSVDLRSDNTDLIGKVITEVCRQLGFGKPPKIEREHGSYTKVYPQYGKLTINCHYLTHGEAVQLNMSLKKDRGYPTYTLYGSQDANLPISDMTDIIKSASWFIEKNLSYWEESINKYYHPQYDKHSEYDKNSGRAFTNAEIGKTLLQFVNLLKRH